MKSLMLALSLCLMVSCAKADSPVDMLIGKWRPVEKALGFQYEIQKDGTLLIKADNGNVVAARWKFIEPDLFAVSGLGTPGPPDKFRFEGDKLIFIDAAKGTERVAIRIKD